LLTPHVPGSFQVWETAVDWLGSAVIRPCARRLG